MRHAIVFTFGLALISGWYSAKLLERDLAAEIAASEAHLALMAAMGCAVMVFAEGSGTTHGDRRGPTGGFCGKDLRARKHNVHLAVGSKHFPSSMFNFLSR